MRRTTTAVALSDRISRPIWPGESIPRRRRALQFGNRGKPIVMTHLRTKEGLAEVVSFIEQHGMFAAS